VDDVHERDVFLPCNNPRCEAPTAQIVRDHHIGAQLIHKGLDSAAGRKHERVNSVPKTALRNTAPPRVEYPIDVANRLSRVPVGVASRF
jgi:hypothetical protein